MKLNHEEFAKDLLKRFDSRINGSAYDENINAIDKQDIMVGMLGAERVKQKFGENDEIVIDLEKQYENLPSINLTYLTQKNSGTFNLIVGGDFYYRVKPQYDNQKSEFVNYFNIKYGTDFTNVSDIKKYIDEYAIPLETRSIIDVYNKFHYDNSTCPISLNKNYFFDGFYVEYDEEINKNLNIELDKLEYLSFQFIKGKKNYVLNDIENEKKFDELINSSMKNIKPNWSLKCIVKIRSFNNDLWQVDIVFYNGSPSLKLLESAYDENVYNANICVIGVDGAKFEDIQTGYLKKTYKHQPATKALSSNAAVFFDHELNSICTNCLPKVEQKRIITNNKYDSNITFDSMIDNPIINLKKIHKDMKTDYESINNRFMNQLSLGKINKSEEELFRRDLSSYKSEIDRFELGIKCIGSIHYVDKAFKYMNMTMKRKMFDSQKTYHGWRLFQIIFIVSLISDVIKGEYADNPLLDNVDMKLVDLLYFSTGGGKTEAFLGITTFTMFFDRLRGKETGVSSIIKYPLRLLSVQQLDRCLSMIVKANSVIKEYEPDKQPFRVGYLVGEGNTPNQIKKEIYEDIISSPIEDAEDKYRVVEICPYCGSHHITIAFNKKKWVLNHKCKECGNVLPLYTVDDEVYRFLPTVLISTIDKLASIGNQRKYKSLFGGIKYYCKEHGFSIDNKCHVSDLSLNCHLESVENAIYDPIPTLIVQDELHLVRESLGTFSSHYETFLQTYCEELVEEKYRKTIKYIGATATISSYNGHIYNLYGLNSRRFPCEYPSRTPSKDFYSHESGSVSRIIQGLTPYGISVTDSIQVLNTIFRKVLNGILSNIDEEIVYWNDKGYEVSKELLFSMAIDYWISIVYNNSKRESQDLENLFSNQGNNTLSSLGIPEYIIAKISGDEDFKEIKAVLSDIELDEDKRLTKNLILATSSISHGVDEDSFNQMYFFGLPNNTAEYIQAYSRVGRKYTGIIIDVFRLVRERDRSYLKYFDLFHENKDLTIEPVPIDRWARNAIHHTLPGIFNAVILQYYEQRNGKAYNNVKSFVELMNHIDKDELIKIVKKSYRCDDVVEMKSKFYSKIIEDEITNMVDSIAGFTGRAQFVSDLISKYSKDNLRPMISLRDYEDGIEIKAK